MTLINSEDYFTQALPPMPEEVVLEESIAPTAARAASVNQPTKHPSPKIAAVGMGGGFLATVLAWVKARFDLEFTTEDVQLLMLVGTFVAGYFTKDRIGQVIATRKRK